MNIIDKLKGKKKRLLAVIIAMACGIFALLCALFFVLFRVQRWTTVTYELGTELNAELSYYLFGTPYTLKGYELDLSAIDNMTAGSYSLELSNGEKAYVYEINIEDTVEPTLVIKDDFGTINIGTHYDFDLVVQEASDLSGPVELEVSVNGEKCDELYFSTLGSYTITVTGTDVNSNSTTEVFDIQAVDTIAPQVVMREDIGYFAVGEAYVLGDIVEPITDNSGSYETTISVDGNAISGDVIFSECGEYELEILATDASGNAGKATQTVYADLRPELYGIADKTIKLDTDYDVLEGVLAWDNEEGFITDRISVEGTVDTSVEGSTTIVYTIVDQNGLSQEQSIEITVSASEYNTNTAIYPEDLLNKLLDADYFTYELLEECDGEKAAELMYPCQVAFRTSSFSGSGFIYAIDEEYIYIGTMGHCIPSNYQTSTIDMWFYNPTYDSSMAHNSVRRCVEGIQIEECVKKYTYNGEDRGMMKISIDQIPMDVLIYLKEVNKTNANNISTENGIYTDTIYVARDMYTGVYKKELHVFDKVGADYDYMLDYFPYYRNSEVWLLTNETGVSGQSGSLLYDGYGNPIASLSGDIYYNGKGIGRHVWFSLFEEIYNELKDAG